jgi:Family of unknown function (DUF6166)
MQPGSPCQHRNLHAGCIGFQREENAREKRSEPPTEDCDRRDPTRRRAMKIYEGGRSLDGAVVTVDGAPLDPRFDIRRFSRMGFEWTYEGDGPRQLALALLADHLGDTQRALALTESFMRNVVAELDNAWRLSGADIEAALEQGDK